jgi:uncharacterized protein YgiM (DUF1202 family)
MYKKSTFLIIIITLIISLACSIPGTITSTATPIVITATSAPLTDTPIHTEAPVITSTFTTTSSPTLDISETPTLTATLGIPMVTPSSVNVNCRFGPSLDYLATGALVVGEIVPITGKLANNSWWEIENKLDPGKKCWVAASATTTSGNLAPVPVKSAPDAFVINVSITAPESIDGVCGGPNATSFEVSITTNGPTTVKYHMAIYNDDGSLRNETPTETLNFAEADTKTLNPGGTYKTDCGSFYAIIYVTSPNNLEDRVNWTVSQPL